MDTCLDLSLPKNLDMSLYNINESFFEWDGIKIPQNPQKYYWGKDICLEKNDHFLYYKESLNNHININSYFIYTIKGNSLSDLEWAINKQQDVFDNSFIKFSEHVLGSISTWIIVLSVDDEKLYKIHEIEEISKIYTILKNCLNWVNPQSAILIKK